MRTSVFNCASLNKDAQIIQKIHGSLIKEMRSSALSFSGRAGCGAALAMSWVILLAIFLSNQSNVGEFH